MTNLIHLLASILFLFMFTSPTLSSDNVLYSSHKLLQDESLTYKDYALTLQHNCNLVLTGPNHKILWQTYTTVIAARCTLVLYPNGELILHGQFHILRFVLWRSGVRSESGDYALVLNYDGSLKIYGKSLWSSPNKISDGHKDSKPFKVSNIPVTDSTLWSGDIAPIGTIIVKDNYKLELGWTCNMTLTDTTTKSVLWNTNTTDITRDCFVNLDSEGKLKIKYLGGATLWDKTTGSDWGQEYVLVLKPEGVLTVYGPVIWSLKKFFGGEANIAMVTA